MSTYDLAKAARHEVDTFSCIWEKVADKSETETYELPWAFKLTVTKRHSDAAGKYILYRLDRFNAPRVRFTQLRTNGECESCTQRRALRTMLAIYNRETVDFILRTLDLTCTCPGGNRA